MTIQLTDSQISRLFFLCAKVAAVLQELPAPPQGFERDEAARLESAKNLRSSLEAKNDILVELGALLR